MYVIKWYEMDCLITRHTHTAKEVKLAAKD